MSVTTIDLEGSPEVPEQVRAANLPAGVRVSIYLMAFIALSAAFATAREVLIPIILAILLALALSPIVRSLKRRGVSHVASSATLVSMVAIGLVALVVSIGLPAARWVEATPHIGERLEERLRDLRAPVAAVSKAGERVEEASQLEADGTPVTEVVIKEESFLSRMTDHAILILSTVGLTLLLAFFLLATSDVFYSKLISLSPTLTAKKNSLVVVRSIEKVVSRYLLTVTLINGTLGVAVGTAMWALGLPNPYLWGALAALLNFMPYVGMVIGVVLIGIVALVSVDSLTLALAAPAVYLALTSIEGGALTPFILGRRLALNTVAILLAISYWGWLWGVIGLFIAVPTLVIIKVVCDNVPALEKFGAFLGANRESAADTDAAEETAPTPATAMG